MTVGPGTFAIDGFVLLLAQFRASKTMGGGEVRADSEKGFHRMSEIVGPEARLFVKTQCRDRQMGAEALPDHANQRFGGGQATLRSGNVKFRPGFIKEAEVQLAGDLMA